MKRLAVLSLPLLLAFSAPAFSADDTLYQDLGGKPGMDKLVDASVDLYLADPRIKDIFSESNIDRIRAELKDQFCMIADGPCRYTGHSMEATHKGLHLTNANFNALVEDLQSAMDACNIPFATQNRFLARLAPMQHQVVTR
ncbi:MAG TPA: group 1 truncated hemoglobin [Rhizomicrobium sp.]|jgi:hemoglobin|nr:group 1 truncated hemoglobin [Rhizomicrobium sp.]